VAVSIAGIDSSIASLLTLYTEARVLKVDEFEKGKLGTVSCCHLSRLSHREQVT
jgi:hypothetical protein